MRLKILILIIGVLSLANVANAKKKNEKEDPFLIKLSIENDIDSFKSSLKPQDTTDLTEEQVDLTNETIVFDDFMSRVKTNHPDIISAELEKKIAEAKRLETQGAFDPAINSETSFWRFNSSVGIGEVRNTFLSNSSLDFLTRSGAKFGVGARFANGDIKTPVIPAGSTGEYYIKATLPLLRDAIYNSKSIKEKSAKLYETITDFLVFRTKIDILQAAAKAYWYWIFNKQSLDIEQDLLSLIGEQVSFVQEQSDLGNLPNISVVEAQREFQKRQVKVNKNVRLFQESSIHVSKYMWTDNGTPYPIPQGSQTPSEYEVPKALGLEEIELAKFNALKKRPEFRALDLSRDISILERKLATNQMLPQLDSYVESGYQTGQDSIGPTIRAGLDISLPLRYRKARGQRRQAKLKIKQLNLQERKLVQNVFLEIEDIASEIDTAFQRYLAAKKDYELSQELEQGEKDKFELGDSTLFLVIRRQRATVEANIELMKSIADYNIAITKFKLVQGEVS